MTASTHWGLAQVSRKFLAEFGSLFWREIQLQLHWCELPTWLKDVGHLIPKAISIHLEPSDRAICPSHCWGNTLIDILPVMAMKIANPFLEIQIARARDTAMGEILDRPPCIEGRPWDEPASLNRVINFQGKRLFKDIADGNISKILIAKKVRPFICPDDVAIMFKKDRQPFFLGRGGLSSNGWLYAAMTGLDKIIGHGRIFKVVVGVEVI